MKEEIIYCYQCDKYLLDEKKDRTPSSRGKKSGICRITNKEVLGVSRYCGKQPQKREERERPLRSIEDSFKKHSSHRHSPLERFF